MNREQLHPETPVPSPVELLRLKEDILTCWHQLPPEHQASVLLVLLEQSPEADWSVYAYVFKKQQNQRQSPDSP